MGDALRCRKRLLPVLDHVIFFVIYVDESKENWHHRLDFEVSENQDLKVKQLTRPTPRFEQCNCWVLDKNSSWVSSRQ